MGLLDSLASFHNAEINSMYENQKSQGSPAAGGGGGNNGTGLLVELIKKLLQQRMGANAGSVQTNYPQGWMGSAGAIY